MIKAKNFIRGLMLFMMCIGMCFSSFACNSGNQNQSNIENPGTSSSSVAKTYTVTVNNGTGGGIYNEGEEVTVTATIPAAMQLKGWYVDGKNVSKENPYTFTVTKNIRLTPRFEDAVVEYPDFSAGAEEYGVDFVVEVESGRDIRVLQLTDIQIQNFDEVEERVFWYMKEIIPTYDPDLIIVTGDLVYGRFDNEGESLQALIKLMDSLGVPWAPVFGNHDNESTMGADWQCAQLEQSRSCLFKQRNLTGNGNYSVGVVQDKQLIRAFFMMDSSGCWDISEESLANGHSKQAAGFGTDQVEFLLNGIDTIKSVNKNATVQPKVSLGYHIQMQVFSKALAANGVLQSDTFDFDKDTSESTIGFYIGNLKTPWDVDCDIWNKIKATGMVDSMFFGHEHGNNASILYEGIRLGYGLKTGTYDRANYINSDGSVTIGSFSYVDDSKPMIGGTAIEFNSSGTINTHHIYSTPYYPVSW